MLVDGDRPETSSGMEKHPSKRFRLSIAGKKDSWKHVKKSCTPSLSTVVGKFPKVSSLQTAASTSNQRIAARRPEHAGKSEVTIADCEITQELQETVEHKIQESHHVAYRTDLQYRSAPFINMLDSSNCAFIDAKTNGDVSALLFVYGIEDHPIYLKDFMQLLRETDLSPAILDACTYALCENYPNSSVFVAASLQGKQILLSPRDHTLTLEDLNLSKHENILLPLRLDKEWILLNVKLRITEISVWHPTRDHNYHMPEKAF